MILYFTEYLIVFHIARFNWINEIFTILLSSKQKNFPLLNIKVFSTATLNFELVSMLVAEDER